MQKQFHAEFSPSLSSGRRSSQETFYRHQHSFALCFGFVFGFVCFGIYHVCNNENSNYFSAYSNDLEIEHASLNTLSDYYSKEYPNVEVEKEAEAIQAVTKSCETNLNYFKKSANWTWIPKPHRYLVAMCMEGQYSNRIRCFSHSAVAASALNRTLLIPLEDLNNLTSQPYNYALSLDVKHARHCLGTGSVFSVEEYLSRTNSKSKSKSKSHKLQIQKLFCFFRTCEFIPKNKWRSLSLPSKEEDIVHLQQKDMASSSPLSSSSEIKWKDFTRAFADVEEEIISLGDLFFVQIEGISWVEAIPLLFPFPASPSSSSSSSSFSSSSPPPPNLKSCKLIFKPHNAILKASKGFVREFIGPDFAALHLRRSDFYRDKPLRRRYLFPIQNVAKCLVRKLTELQIRVLFVATDASEAELELLEKLLHAFSPPSHTISVAKLPSMAGEVWAQDLNEMNLANDPTAIAMVDKLVCSMSKTFFSSRGSTFSTYIHHVRESLNVSSCDDQFICKGEFWHEFVPNAFSTL